MPPNLLPPGLAIVHEDDDLLAVNKPAGLVCHPSKHGPLSSLIGRLRLHLGPLASPQLINRLDRETSGLVLAAKNPDAARTARVAWENREVLKEYWAIVHGTVSPNSGSIHAPLGPHPSSPVAIKSAVRPDGAAASTHFQVLHHFHRPEGPFTWLQLLPTTGRKHQLRLHLAHLGHPIVGDKLYGFDEDCYLALVEDRLTDLQRQQLILPFHALHARRIVLPWPTGTRSFLATPEPWFLHFLPPNLPHPCLLEGATS